jgi:sugar (pentulose or hexulose) kinase
MAVETKLTLLVVDIGKTNIKLTVLAEDGMELYHKTAANRVINQTPYPHFDDAFIWKFIISGIEDATNLHSISHVCVSAHGAAAALVDPDMAGSGLVLPIMDYEWDGVDEYNDEYSRLRPKFNESYSPELPSGLNLGRQLYWQSKKLTDDFSKAKYIFPLAQYWTWRLTGIAASEVSALGCHTDLWAPIANDFSSFVYAQKWQSKFPPLAPAWSILSHIHPDISRVTGLSPNCKVLAGVHDSNASLARFLKLPHDEIPVVISTGTWAITMNSGGDDSKLDAARDMLANVDVTGKSVCCARFMGGREYAEICKHLEADVTGECALQGVQEIIDNDVFALPDYSGGSGPYGGQTPRVIGTPKSAHALAALYCALMIDVELDLLGADRSIVIEGSFAQNPIICNLVSAIRPKQNVFILNSDSGVAQGCLNLALWNSSISFVPKLKQCPKINLDSLSFYRNLWREHCNNTQRINYA